MSQESFFNKLINRFEDNEYLNIFGWKDTQQGAIKSKSFKAIESNIPDILKTIKNFNTRGTAVGFCINPLKSQDRTDENISRILHIPIDVDKNPSQEEIDKITQSIIELGFYPNYFGKSGGGYHIILDVDLPIEDQEYVAGFLKYLKLNVCEKIDDKIYNPGRILRAPETIHWRNGKFTTKIQFEDEEIRAERIQTNSSNIKTYTNIEKKEKKEKTTQEVSQELNKSDIFFTALIYNKNLWNYLSNKDSIEKNDKLFKNLAAFDFLTEGKHEKEIEEFVEAMNHNYAEYQGWFEKEIEVNYEELRNWINDFNLEALKPYIREQLTKNSNYLNDFQYAYVEGIQNQARYLLYQKEKKYWSFHTKTQLLEYLFLNANQRGIDLAQLFGLIYIEGWDDMKIGKKQQMINDKIFTYLYENTLINQIYDIGYMPTKDRFFVRNNKMYFNIYKEGPLEFHKDSKKLEEYKFPYIDSLMRHLYGANGEEAYKYAMKWYAYIKQNPTHKIPTSIIVKSIPGAGKGRLKQWVIAGIWGSWNISEIDQTNLDNIWGDYLIDKRWIFCNEIKLDTKTNPRVYARIKQQSCDEEFLIQQKNKQAETFYNYTHWNFQTNDDDFMRIEDDDRRFTIYEQKDKISQDIVNYLSPQLNPGYLEKELKEFAAYLEQYPTSYQEVSTPYETEIKTEMKQNNKDTIANFFEEIQEFEDIEEFANVFSLLVAPKLKDKSYILTSDFHKLYQDWCFKNNIRMQKSLKGFGMIMKTRYYIESVQDRNIEPSNRRFYWLEDIKNVSQ